MDLRAALERFAAEGAVALAAITDDPSGRSIMSSPDQLVFHTLDPLEEVYLLVEGEVRLFAGEGELSRTTLLLRAPALFGDRDIAAGCSTSQESA